MSECGRGHESDAGVQGELPGMPPAAPSRERSVAARLASELIDWMQLHWPELGARSGVAAHANDVSAESQFERLAAYHRGLRAWERTFISDPDVERYAPADSEWAHRFTFRPGAGSSPGFAKHAVERDGALSATWTFDARTLSAVRHVLDELAQYQKDQDWTYPAQPDAQVTVRIHGD